MKINRHPARVIFLVILFNLFTSTLHAEEVFLYDYEVINTYPHDPGAFTQGLIFNDGYLYESTGNYGHSRLRKVELKTGVILKEKKINNDIFAEGLALFKQQLVQLSWRSGAAFIYDKGSFNLIETHQIQGEGWGLTTHGNQLIMSDGSSVLRFLNPGSFEEIRRVSVSLNGRPVKHLNELEMVKGTIFANVWQTDQIVMISPKTGKVTGVINLAGLLHKNELHGKANVLNGIAYDKKEDRLFVTGKYWPKLFEINLIQKTGP